MWRSKQPRGGSACRAVAAGLAVVYLSLALGGTRHVLEHDGRDLAWLLPPLHHHAFHWVELDDGADLRSIDHCLLCEISRWVAPDATLAQTLPAMQDRLERNPVPSPGHPSFSALSDRSPRAPPLV